MSDGFVPGPIRVVGNLLTDLVIGGVEEMPEWGQEVAGNRHRFVPSGQATYISQALQALGLQTEVVGAVGADGFGGRILASLRSYGAGTDRIKVESDETTAITVAIVRPDGERSFISDFACQSKVDYEFLRHQVPSEKGTFCLVGLMNLPNLDAESARKLLNSARASGCLTVLDTGWDPGGWKPDTIASVRSLLADVDLFLPNLDEARALTGKSKPEEVAEDLSGLCAGRVVLKLGRDGSLAVGGGESISVPAFRVDPIDTVGAGDSFNAGLLYGLSRGSDFESAMKMANAVASIYISRSQNRHADAAELGRLISEEHEAIAPLERTGEAK